MSVIARSVALVDSGPTFQKQKLQMVFREDFAWVAQTATPLEIRALGATIRTRSPGVRSP